MGEQADKERREEVTAGVTNMRRFPNSTTMIVSIKIHPELRLRLWIARALITLAARVLGCGLGLSMVPDWKKGGMM